MTNVYTIDQIARHNKTDDLWIMIHGVIYNITKFYKEHPGGEEVLLKLAGKDATDCFENIGHSEEAINLREKFKIGVLVDRVNSDTSETTEMEESMEDDWQYKEQRPKMQSLNLVWIFACAIVIYAIIIYYWFKL